MTEEISAAFPFESKYADVHGSKMHYIDVGEGNPILFLHGNPTSSYLWRNVIPHVQGLGRCIAPDLIGMGKSDKPRLDYSFMDHYRYLERFIETLELHDVLLVVHDWGGALGFHYGRLHPDNVRGYAFMETIVRPLTWDEWPEQATQVFQAFRTPGLGEQMILENNAFIEQILPGAVLRPLTDEEMTVYREPYLEHEEYRLPTLRWPREIPIEGEPVEVHEAATLFAEWLTQTPVPKLLLTATPGAIMRVTSQWCIDNLSNLTAVDIGPGVHFLQEDQPHAIGRAIAGWMQELA
ncbi:MAG TPA: haloalkane dehalogenase [Dehalococcoidia bacterium]|nr:haloalkane dehalogenase [Dehalococcoidia bacterium]